MGSCNSTVEPDFGSFSDIPKMMFKQGPLVCQNVHRDALECNIKEWHMSKEVYQIQLKRYNNFNQNADTRGIAGIKQDSSEIQYWFTLFVHFTQCSPQRDCADLAKHLFMISQVNQTHWSIEHVKRRNEYIVKLNNELKSEVTMQKTRARMIKNDAKNMLGNASNLVELDDFPEAPVVPLKRDSDSDQDPDNNNDLVSCSALDTPKKKILAPLY